MTIIKCLIDPIKRQSKAHCSAFFLILSTSFLVVGCGGTNLPSSSQSSSMSAIVSSSSYIQASSSSFIQASSRSSIPLFSSSLAASASSSLMMSSSSSLVSSSSSASSLVAISGDLVVAVNAGGPAIRFENIDFEADKYSRGGMVNSTTEAIAGTNNDVLFQTQRWGKYSYEIPVTNATYAVRLHFNELYHSAPAKRVFSASVEGKPALTQFDLFASIGGNTAYSLTLVDIPVSDGSLTITLDASVDNGTLSGFEIYSVTGELNEPEFPVVEAKNPNIWADVPDMSIIRVGDIYYMSSTTMHLNPGVPIMKSTDLVNWEVINYAHKALDAGSNALNLNGATAYGKGTWASSINYKNNTFYVTSFSYTTGKTYLWKTNNIEGGSWTQTTFNSLYHDSSLIMDDDGRAYIAYGSDNVRLIELNADLSGVKAGGVNQSIIASASAVAGTNFILKAEGTQIQKINGWYYISNICWPSGKSRTQVIHRSRSITGPYEGRVVLSEGVAQGQYVSTPEGKWYLYAFKDSGGVGRIPYLVPINWVDNWPVVAGNGKVPATLGFQAEDKGLSGLIRSDEFNTGNLDLVWQWNHNPNNNGWSLTQRSGYLRITNTRTDANIHATQNTLTQRMFGPTSSAVVKLDVGNMKDGDVAGFAAFQDQYGFVGVKQSGSQRYLVMVNNNAKDHREIENVTLNQTTVYLKVNGDFTANPGRATFAYSLDGSTWKSIGNTVTTNYELTHFMGYRFALFNFAGKSTGGFVDFDYFRLQ